MLAKYALGLAATAMLTSVAFAQTPTATTDATTDKAAPAATDKAAPAAAVTDAASLHGNWRTSKAVGLSVYNDSNESIGSINDLLMDKSGNIKAVVIGVGGFLGLGEHLVAMPLDKVKFVTEPVAYTGTSSNTAPKSTSGAGSTTTTGAAPASTSKPNPWYPDHAVVSASKDQLKSMTEFKYTAD